MEIKKTVLARGASDITNGVMIRLTGLLDCPEAEAAVKKAVSRFKRAYGRKPQVVQLAVSFVVPCRPGINQRIQIQYWSFAAKVLDTEASGLSEQYTNRSKDHGPIELKHLGNNRYGL